MKANKIIPAGILTVLICAAIPLYPHLAQHNSKNIPLAVNNAINRYHFNDISFTEYTDNGAAKKFTINGKKFGVATKRFGIFLLAPFASPEIKDAEVLFYRNNVTASLLRAKTALFGAPVNNNEVAAALAGPVEFSGDITVMTEDRRTLTCDKLAWDSRNGTLRASGRCILRYEGKFVKADFIDSDVQLKNFSFRNDKMKRLRALTRMLI